LPAAEVRAPASRAWRSPSWRRAIEMVTARFKHRAGNPEPDRRDRREQARSTFPRPTISSSRSPPSPRDRSRQCPRLPPTTFRAGHHDRGRGQGRGALHRIERARRLPGDHRCAGRGRDRSRAIRRISRAHPVLRQPGQHVRRRARRAVTTAMPTVPPIRPRGRPSM
jgi:hypothetical protein